eukprot:CAMPEP_0181440654 /NCGR_PEP_ID=MMETSP1110-20121109/23085_1 /TAXON_ID=174948 /ORGANISM="Symbiodinium sp., Strain CCMP421" /LENGTH=82 /DNA_ID=CAMNT_0023564477 /DNA_START=56 /DNA_END=301 /DNA_ORIENTATION=+
MVAPVAMRGLFAFGLVVSAYADSTFSKVKAQLEANVTLSSNGAWHIGGFCFGQGTEESSKAAEIRAHVTWEGQRGLNEMGPV